jgi:hypothetical protein
MKIKHYNEMMAYLTRPGFNGGGAVSNRTVLPKRKPPEEVKKRKKINYEKIKQYLGKESQELIERELGFAIGGSVETPKRGLVDEPGSYSQDRPERKFKVKLDDKGFLKFLKKSYDDNADFAIIKKVRKKLKNKNASVEEILEAMNHQDRSNFKGNYQNELKRIEQAKFLKKNKYISEAELGKLVGIENFGDKVKHFRTNKAYEVLKPYRGPQVEKGSKGKSKYYYLKPNAKQIKAIQALHVGKGGAQGGPRPGTLKAILKLHNDKVFTNFLKNWKDGDPVPDNIVKKIFSANAAYSPNTVMEYGRFLEGKGIINPRLTDETIGDIKDALKLIPKNKLFAEKIRQGMKYQTNVSGHFTGTWHKAARDYAIRKMDEVYNPRNAPGKTFGARVNAIRKTMDDLGLGKLNIDEIQALRTGLSGGTEPYSIFSQLLTKKMNIKVKGNIFDPQTSKRQIRLNEAIKKFGKNSQEVADIIKEQDTFVRNFRKDYPDFQKINLTRFDLRSPIEVMGEKRFRSLPVEARKSILQNYKDRGYSLNLGRNLVTQKELAEMKPVKLINKLEGLKLLEKAGIKISQCFLRKNKSGGGRLEGETQQQCITRNVNSEINRAKRTKDFSKFKNLRGFLKGTLAVDIPLELMFTMPHLISGDYEAAKRASTLGLFGYGGNAIDDFKDNPEVLKYVNTQNKTIEFVNQYRELDRLENEIQDRTKRYEDPGNNPLFKQQLESDINYLTGEYNRIGSEYNNTLEKFENKELGYDTIEDETKARKATQQALETQQKNLRFGFKPITNLEQAIEQNFSEYPRAVTKAQELIPETPEGSPMLFDLGLPKDIRDSFGEIPLKYSSELGALEAKETREGLKRKQTEGILRSTGIPLAKQIPNLFDFSKSFFRGYAGGGIAKQAGVESGPPPESGPNSQGLAFLMKRGR